MTDREVVDAFVNHLRDHGSPGLLVEQRPDEVNRDSQDVDAIAGPFAIEHTSIDTLPYQRRDAAWFMQAIGEMRREFVCTLPFRLSITLAYDAVGKGQDWSAIRHAIGAWIAGPAHKLSDGCHMVDDIPGVPFPIHARKSSTRRPGVFFGRYRPDDDTLPARLKQIMDRKAGKLLQYQQGGKVTILLVESEDLALMNESAMLDSIRTACSGGLPHGVDQVWYADTSIPEFVEFSDFTREVEDTQPRRVVLTDGADPAVPTKRPRVQNQLPSQ